MTFNKGIKKSRSLLNLSFTVDIKTPEICVLLVENIHADAAEAFRRAGYKVDHYKKALPESELKEKLAKAHILGIRSKTTVTKELLESAPLLLAIGCFCIGTNQVDLQAASEKGARRSSNLFHPQIVVFNSPFSNSRSVAELMIAEIISLARHLGNIELGDRNMEMHSGKWNKVSDNCHEIRGKTLGIIGYGHIGSQLSVLSEAMGLNVVYHDIAPIMPIGTATGLESLESVLQTADFVTLHVPETEETINMISEKELKLMKKGAILLNASRGTVVDLAALKIYLENGHLGGAALDVYPNEPFSNSNGFFTGLENCANVILTPHIGGSTEEAQYAIGQEVSSSLIKYINEGNTSTSVNFPEVDLRSYHVHEKTVRILNVHRNVPGVLKVLNNILAEYNINKQICDSNGDIGYFAADITVPSAANLINIYEELCKVKDNIRTRVLC